MPSTRLRSRGSSTTKASEAIEAPAVNHSEHTTELHGPSDLKAVDDNVFAINNDSKTVAPEETITETNNNIESEISLKTNMSASQDSVRRCRKKSKEKQLRKQIKVMKKDCKKLEKSLGQWMLETGHVPTSSIKANVKDFLKANVQKPDKSAPSNLPSGTNVYRWNSPHIRSFFASSKRSIIQTNRLDIKLVCPIGKQRIKHPVRGSSCQHVQPFDRETFLKLERVSKQKKKKSFCPICNLEISSCNLVDDSFFVEVLKKSHVQDEDVVVYADGLWHPSARREKKKMGEGEIEEEEVVLDDEKDDDDEIVVMGITRAEKKDVVIDLTDDSFVEDNDNDVVVL